MSLTLVQWENSTVTPKLDAIMYDDGSYGIVKGCAITHQGTNLLKIASGFIKIAGRLIEVSEETITCEVSASGTVNGQLWVRLNLGAVTPVSFMSEAAAVLTPLTQNEDCNFENGIYELQLATYNIDESVITNLVETAPELEKLRTALDNIDLSANKVTYDNTHSGMAATKVQGAIDEINDNLAQTPITVGGETLSTIDDKLNFIIEGLPLTDIDNYEIYHYYPTISGAKTFTMTNKIVMVFCTGGYQAEDSCIGNKNGSLNYYPAYVTLNVTDDYNFTITTVNSVGVKIIVLMEKTSS